MSEEPSWTGRVLGHFRVLAELGRGGMGVVYRARDEKLGREVALKVLPPAFTNDEERRRRFLREARSAAAVVHPNIATVFEVGDSDGLIFLAMELVDGESLRSRLAGGPVAVAESVRIARCMARALAKAHAAGIVHRDIKPDNVLLGDDGQVKILDFGLAKLRAQTIDAAVASGSDTAVQQAETASHITEDGRILGTPGYMSPEQARGKPVDARTDVFALGVVLYELLSGRQPFPGETTMDRLIAVSRDDPAPLELDPSLAPLTRIVERCLAKDPAARYSDGGAVLGELEALTAFRSHDDSRPTSDDVPPVHPSATGAATTAADDAQPAGSAAGHAAAAGASTTTGTTQPQSARRRALQSPLLKAAAIVVLLAAVVGTYRSRRGEPPSPSSTASPLAAPGAVLACPQLEASGVESPAGWLGAAAADIACRRATIVLGGAYERTLLPAQLLDVPTEVSDSLPDDLYGQSDSRPKAMAAAKTRAQAWLDGSVERQRRDFVVTLVLRSPDGQERARGSAHGTYLYEAVREAMAPLVSSGAIPRADALTPSEATWSSTSDPDARLALFDMELSATLSLGNPSVAECERVARHAQAIGQYPSVEAVCTEIRNDTPEGVPPVAVDRSSAAAFAITAPYALRYDPKLDAKALDAEAQRFYQLADSPRARAELAALRVNLGAIDDETSMRTLAFSVVQDDPRNFSAWANACGASMRQKGSEAAARAFQLWTPEQPDAWNIGSFADAAATPEQRAWHSRRAVVLSPDYPLFADNLAETLLSMGKGEEVRTLAARLATGGAKQRIGAEALLAQVEANEGKFAAGLERAQRALQAVPVISRLDWSDMSLVETALDLGLLLDRGHEVADALAERFVLNDPPKLFAYQGYTTYNAGLVCLHASKELGLRCVRRLRKLMAEGYFKGGSTALIPSMLEGLERAFEGDRPAAVRLWRQLPTVVRGTEIRVRLLDGLGEHDLAASLDRSLVEHADTGIHGGGFVNGASFAHVREAVRAEKRGDKAAARQLAEKVVKAWGSGDADVPAVGEMRKLLDRTK
jgi:eukaryotic-like serine/threonine-protein kinase